MKIVSSTFVFPVSSPPIKNGVIVLDKDDTIVDVINPANPNFNQKEILHHPDMQYYEGFITPGFVNCHCHLELSYLKGKIKPHTGLNDFIFEIEKLKKSELEDIYKAIQNAEQEMIENGIIAVGDISNNTNSFNQKMLQNIHYHTFIEVFSFKESNAERTFNNALILYENYRQLLKHYNAKFQNSVSINPHAPYSVSFKLLNLIKEHLETNDSIVSLHNQENGDENIFFKEKKGVIVERLNAFGINLDDWQATGLNSLESILQHLPYKNKIQLVHNTVSTNTDRKFAEQFSRNIYWCFCPGANLYIENMLPDFSVFEDIDDFCTIGTDSLASNTSLSILDEIKLILNNAPSISFEKALRWACLNGSKYLNFESVVGSIEIGKKPGLNLLTNVDAAKLSITNATKIKNLLN